MSYKLIEIAFEVHNQLGPGFSEDIYEKAVICELEALQTPYEQQKLIRVFYKGQAIGVYRLDLVIDGKIILELKLYLGSMIFLSNNYFLISKILIYALASWSILAQSE